MTFDLTGEVTGVSTRDGGLRTGLWRGVTVGVLTARFGPLPADPLGETARYLCQLAALQTALATDFAAELLGPAPVGEVYPSTDELPPTDLVPGHRVLVDARPVDTWATTLRGCRVAVGHPQHHPLVLLASPGPDVGWPPLLTR